MFPNYYILPCWYYVNVEWNGYILSPNKIFKNRKRCDVMDHFIVKWLSKVLKEKRYFCKSKMAKKCIYGERWCGFWKPENRAQNRDWTIIIADHFLFYKHSQVLFFWPSFLFQSKLHSIPGEAIMIWLWAFLHIQNNTLCSLHSCLTSLLQPGSVILHTKQRYQTRKSIITPDWVIILPGQTARATLREVLKGNSEIISPKNKKLKD